MGKLTRNLAFSRYRRLHAEKRGSGQTPLALDELSECVSGKNSVEQELRKKDLIREIERFLDSLPPRTRRIFLRRYWYCDSLEAIAGQEKRSVGSIAMLLSRTRTKLKRHLAEKELY